MNEKSQAGNCSGAGVAAPAAGAARVFVDHGESSRLRDRPQWLACLDYLRDGDTLVVRALDRIAGTTTMAIETISELHDRGINIKSLTEPDIDTTSPMGRALFGIVAVFAQLRVDTIRENTRRGLEHARANGTTPQRLAAMWRDNLAVAMGGKPLARGLQGKGSPAVQRVSPGDDRYAGTRVVQEATKTKIVPILTIGSGGRVGVAQVAGPVSRVDEVKAVVQLETDYKDSARIRVLVPIASENVVSNIRRVPQVSITGEAGLRF